VQRRDRHAELADLLVGDGVEPAAFHHQVAAGVRASSAVHQGKREAHPGHSLDVPHIARRTGALVVGTASTANLARASGVPERQLEPVAGREALDVRSVTVRVIPSLHGSFRRPIKPDAVRRQPPVFPADAKPPFRNGQHVESGTLAHLIGIGGRQIIVFGSMIPAQRLVYRRAPARR
jgi:hypothetical protein